MEFKYLNQPDFDRERDGAVTEILKKVTSHSPNGSLIAATRMAFNEGFKACLKFIKEEYYNPDIPDEAFEELIAEVDKIDKGA